MEQVLQFRKKAATAIAFVLGVYQVYTAVFGIPTVYLHRTIHLGAMLILCFLLIEPSEKYRGLAVFQMILYTLCVAASAAFMIYGMVNYHDIQMRGGTPTQWDKIFCIVLIFLVFLATYKRAGPAITVIAAAFMAYLLWGHLLTGSLRHAPIGARMIYNEFYNATGGILGSCVGIASTYIIIFIIFGAFLNEFGAGDYFNRLANALTRNSCGGPAKAAVIASALLGLINGSAVANVATTGAVTIPLMKRNGYPAEFAAATETAASMGGQILPPVMGSSVFLMASFVNMTYNQICLYAIAPAILYFVSIFIAVHFKAKKLHLEAGAGFDENDTDSLGRIFLSGIHFVIAIAVLVFTMVYGWTPQRCGMLAILSIIVGSLFRKETRVSPKRMCKALIDGVLSSVTLSISCAVSGVIVGVVGLSSLGIKMSTFVIKTAGGKAWIALAITALASIILGMGVLSAAAYIILASLMGPVISSLGINLLAGHLFIYYFGLLAAVTPPVALGALTAASIAKCSFSKTCVLGCRLCIAAFIIPWVFVFDTRVLFLGAPFFSCIILVLTCFCGIYILNVGLSGFMLTDVNVIFRVLACIAGLLFVNTSYVTDISALIIIALIAAQQIFQLRRERQAHSPLG